MSEFPYPAVDYTSRDYASLRQSMIDGIPSRMPEWTSRSPQDFGIVLIELFATMGDVLSYYTDRVANEAFLPTATQRSSVLKLAALLNYRPRGATAAQTTVQFTVDGNLTFTIPARTLLRSRTADGSVPVIFETDTALSVVPSLGLVPHTVSVSATQGRTVLSEQIGVSSGDQDQAFVLLQMPVVESTAIIQVQESPADPARTWTFISNILDARPGDNVYTTTLDANSVLTILFGDSVNGRIPPRSAIITATYRVGAGAAGNVNAATLVEMSNPIPGVMSVTNSDAAVGGADIESIESIRVNAPRSLQALRRAVTLTDFASLALQVPQVAKARAQAEVYSNVSLYIAPFGGGPTPRRLLNDVVSYLADKKLVGVDVVAASPAYTPIDITVTVTVAEANSAAQVRAGVENILRLVLGFDAVDFGQRVSVSDIYTAVALAGGVSHASISRLNRRGDIGVSDVLLQPNEIPIPGTLNIVTIGGITGGDPTGIGAVGTVPTLPSAASAPTVFLSRCDPTSMHLGLSWTPGSNTTTWYVELAYLDSGGATLTSTIVGPANTPNSFSLDLAKNTSAVSVGIRTQAFNGDTGPVYSPITYIANPCA